MLLKCWINEYREIMTYSYRHTYDVILLRFTCLEIWIKGRTLGTRFKMANSSWGKRHHDQFLFPTWEISVLSKFYSVNRYHFYKQKINLNICNSKSAIITLLTSTNFFGPKSLLLYVSLNIFMAAFNPWGSVLQLLQVFVLTILFWCCFYWP